MIFNKPHLLTRMEIFAPRYKDKYGDKKEWAVLLHRDKVDHATPWIIIDFTKAKHLVGQRFCIKKSDAQSYPVTTNGTAPMYEVPMSKLENWETSAEVKELITSMGW